MNPNYQQAMIQALLGQGSAAPGTTGSNPTTPYGQGFITGNMMQPTNNPASNIAGLQNAQNQGMNSSSALTTGPSTQLAQPTSTFTS